MRRTALICLTLVAATAAAALAVRPAWPVDETRYLGVAWGMWARGDFLVPRLNGVLYTDKPPLLFWLMHAGWALFGVNEWWPRLIGPLSALLSLWLTARLARRLFPAPERAPRNATSPDVPCVAELAPLLLCGSLLFTAWSTFLMFDMLLVATTLLALLGLLGARQDGGVRGWLLCGVGLGAGFLVKGPVLLAHVLPAAIAVRWWSPSAGATGAHRAPARGGRWALGVIGAVLLGVAIALLWVIPAGISGGPAYRDALLFGQAAKRLGSTPDVPHVEPWWFYVAMLPVLLLPWSLWPRLWGAVRSGLARGSSAQRAVPAAHATSATTGAPAPTTASTSMAARATGTGGMIGARVDGVRFAAAWALPALVLLSVIGSKQEQYLLPELPAFALVAAALLVRDADAPAFARRGVAALPGVLLAAAGVAMIFAARQWPPLADPDLAGTSATAGIALAAAGAWIACARLRDLRGAVGTLACVCAAVLVAIHLGGPPTPLVQRDLRPAAARIAALEREGRPLAYLGKYRAQYDFFGRLRVPLASLTTEELPAWFAEHGDGVLVSTHATLGRDHPALGLRELASLPSGEWLWERAPTAAPAAPAVRSPGPR